MPTEKLNLPTITGNMAIDVQKDLNALAQAVDGKAGATNGLATLNQEGKVPGNQLDISAPPDATTTTKGIVKLNDSTDSASITEAATANAVRKVAEAGASHSADDAAHVQTGERENWNAKATPEDVRIGLEQTAYSVTKSAPDADGTFTTIEYKRKSDGSLAAKSVLSGGTAPKYTTRTITYYGTDGLPVGKVDVYALSYNADGVLIKEV